MAAIYLSTMLAGGKSIGDVAVLAKNLGLAGIELSSSLPLSAEEFLKIRQQLPPGTNFLVHNYFPRPTEDFVLNLASVDLDILQKSRAHCSQAVQLCAEIGSPFYSVHAGFSFRAAPGDLGNELAHLDRWPLEQAKQVFTESLKELCVRGQAKGVRVLVENNVLAPFNLINGQNALLLGVTAEDLLDIVSSVNMPNLGLLIDMGHLKVSARSLGFSPEMFLKTLRQHIEALHLSDNNGTRDDNSPFDGNAWFFKCQDGFNSKYLIIEVNGRAAADVPKMISALRVKVREKGKA